ncbi:MAG: hypothetical protein K2Y17_14290 [Qipengyuania sp.]|nr:hypothetical protein [Qipengyuania sp.]
MRLQRILREPSVLVALIGFPIGLASIAFSDWLDSSNSAIERAYEAEKNRCDRAFAVAQDDALNARFAGDDEFLAEQLRIAKMCGRRNP